MSAWTSSQPIGACVRVFWGSGLCVSREPKLCDEIDGVSLHDRITNLPCPRTVSRTRGGVVSAALTGTSLVICAAILTTLVASRRRHALRAFKHADTDKACGVHLRLFQNRRGRATLLTELGLMLLVLNNIARERMELRRQVSWNFLGIFLAVFEMGVKGGFKGFVRGWGYTYSFASKQSSSHSTQLCAQNGNSSWMIGGKTSLQPLAPTVLAVWPVSHYSSYEVIFLSK